MKQGLLRAGTAPCLSTFRLPNVTAHDQISLAFPYMYVFAYCKQSNTGGGNGLGTRLRWRCIMEVVLVHLYCSFGAFPAREQGYVVHSMMVQRRLEASNCMRKVAINAVQMTYCNHRTAVAVHSARWNQATSTEQLSIVWNCNGLYSVLDPTVCIIVFMLKCIYWLMGQCRHIHYYILCQLWFWL